MDPVEGGLPSRPPRSRTPPPRRPPNKTASKGPTSLRQGKVPGLDESDPQSSMTSEEKQRLKSNIMLSLLRGPDLSLSTDSAVSSSDEESSRPASLDLNTRSATPKEEELEAEIVSPRLIESGLRVGKKVLNFMGKVRFGRGAVEPFNRNNPVVPPLIADSIAHLTKHGLQTEGLFRVPGSHDQVLALKRSYERGKPMDLSQCHPHVVAEALKSYLRDMKDLHEPLLTYELYNAFVTTLDEPSERHRIAGLRTAVRSLPPGNRCVLQAICSFCTLVAENSAKNKMTHSSLSIVFAPNLLEPPESASVADIAGRAAAMAVVNEVVEVILKRSEDIFSDRAPQVAPSRRFSEAIKQGNLLLSQSLLQELQEQQFGRRRVYTGRTPSIDTDSQAAPSNFTSSPVHSPVLPQPRVRPPPAVRPHASPPVRPLPPSHTPSHTTSCPPTHPAHSVLSASDGLIRRPSPPAVSPAAPPRPQIHPTMRMHVQAPRPPARKLTATDNEKPSQDAGVFGNAPRAHSPFHRRMHSDGELAPRPAHDTTRGDGVESVATHQTSLRQQAPKPPPRRPAADSPVRTPSRPAAVPGLISSPVKARTPQNRAPPPPVATAVKSQDLDFDFDVVIEEKFFPTPGNPAPPPPIYRDEPLMGLRPSPPHDEEKAEDEAEEGPPAKAAAEVEEVNDDEAARVAESVSQERQRELLSVVERLQRGEMVCLQDVFAGLTEDESIFLGLKLAECVPAG